MPHAVTQLYSCIKQVAKLFSCKRHDVTISWKMIIVLNCNNTNFHPTNIQPTWHDHLWGANRISWATPALWVIVYWVFILKYFEQKSLKNLDFFWNYSSHYYVMVYIIFLIKTTSFKKKIKSIYKFFSCLKTLVIIFLKCFRVFKRFQTFKVYISIHWK
jgi:hypothetical protein